jgi:EpsD family peptidyl-prolyl cis-trans isomerase
MTSKVLLVAAVAGLALGAAGCDKVKQKLGGQPSGQVIATVNGEEITALELRNELNGYSNPDPKIMKQAQDQALQQIIVRNILASRARTQKLDKAPQYSLQVRRGERTLLAQMYESKLFSNVAPPTRKEAENYVANNPDKFAKRRIFILDRIVAPANRIDKDKLAALKSLEELKGMLDSQAIPFQETAAAIDTLTASPDTVKGVDKLPPGEVFIFPENNVYVFNRIFQVREAPFRGELAIAFATDQLRKAQAEDFVRTQIVALRRSAESGITYAKGFKPDNPDFGVGPITGGPSGAPQAPQAPADAAAAGPPPASGAAAPAQPASK